MGHHRDWDGEVRGAWIDKGDGWTDLRERIHGTSRTSQLPILNLCAHAQPWRALEKPSGSGLRSEAIGGFHDAGLLWVARGGGKRRKASAE